jgi:glycosyltransferase involved in cell wall biosynthesis
MGVYKKNEVAAISVVIPCFRCASTIARAITSILRQSQKPTEIILVDDASGDDTLKILEAYEMEFAGFIRVVTLKDNTGAASARNAGWAIAKQPYIAFLDADDSWHADKILIQFEYMKKNPDVVLSGHLCGIFENIDLSLRSGECYSVTAISGLGLLMNNAFSTPTVMLKRDIPFRFRDGERYVEDLLLWQQIAFAGLKVVRIESTLAYVHKQFYGASGLSSHLWKMEIGELRNYFVLHRASSISSIQLSVATAFSLLKFVRRLLVTASTKFAASITLRK